MGRDIGDEKVIVAVRRLISLFDGVTVVHVRNTVSGATSIVFRTADQESLARLAGCAENANVGCLVWTDHEGGARLPGRVQFELRTGPELPGREYPAIQHLCVDMAHDLVCRGRLERTEADRILDAAWSDDG